MRIERRDIQKILVIKLRAIGDVLLSTVVLDNLRSAFPDARIDFLTEKPSREVIEGNAALNDVVLFDGKRESSVGLISRIRNQRYDLVIDLFGNPRSAILTYMSRARFRVGYRFKWRQYCYNVVVEPRGGEVHNVEFNLDALRAIGVPIVSNEIEFPLDGVSEQFAEEFFIREHLFEITRASPHDAVQNGIKNQSFPNVFPPEAPARHCEPSKAGGDPPLAEIGNPDTGLPTKVPLSESRSEAESLESGTLGSDKRAVGRMGFVVALNPGGGWYTKRWRIPQYAQLGDALVNEFGAKIILVWGPGEEKDVRELQSKMSQPSILLPLTSLKQLAAFLKRCRLLVTNDSGPMHIAAAVGTPVLAIFGPTNPELQGPVGSHHVVVRNERLLCLGCNFTDCPIGNPCMLELSVSEVLKGVRKILEKSKLTFERTATV